MAKISLAGTICAGKQGGSAVALRTTDKGLTFANFSLRDSEYVPTKATEESRGQFYQVEVVGKAAEIAADRLDKGSFVAVNGQLVQREYKDKIYYEVKNATVTYPPKSGGSSEEDSAF